MDGAHPQPQPLDGSSVLLVVDDYPENLISMRALLARQDWQVLTASSGTEALSALLEHDVDLVLLDVQMPEMDGEMLVQTIKTDPTLRQTVLVLLTTSTVTISLTFGAFGAAGWRGAPPATSMGLALGSIGPTA